VELVFFDAEDSGYYEGWSWIVGSTHYVAELPPERRSTIRAMVLLDMVGDANLQLKRELSSTRSLQDQVWSIAASLGHDDVFLSSYGGSIIDDHRPFLDCGIPALDIIQHDPFPWYWHTLEDTPDKCAAGSLEAVGRVIEAFVAQTAHQSTTFEPDGLSAGPVVLTLAIAAPVLVAVLYLRCRRPGHK
ncbi:hypothetical protein DRO42_07830, partial [Candidatus Bathyarchaeota archaeon]